MADMFTDGNKTISQREIIDILTKMVSSRVGKNDEILSKVATNVNFEKEFYYRNLFKTIGLENSPLSNYILSIFKIRGSLGILPHLSSMELLTLALANKEDNKKIVKNDNKEDIKDKILIDFD